MWQAIGAIFGLATSANEGAQQQLAQQRAEYQNDLDYSRAKTMAFYGAYASSAKSIQVMAAIAFALIAGVLILAKFKK